MARKKSGLTTLLTDWSFMALAAVVLVLAAVISFSPRVSLVALAGRDLTPPAVAITSPTEGTVIGDGVTRLLHIQVTATATDDNMSNLVYLYVDGVQYQRMTGSKFDPDFSSFLYMPDFENGQHVLEVRAQDTRKNVGVASVNVEFNNGVQSDTTPPTISITSPQDGVVYERRTQYKLNFSVSDNQAVGRVETVLAQTNKKGELVEEVKCIDYTGRTESDCFFWTEQRADITLITRAYDFEGNMAEDSVTASVR